MVRLDRHQQILALALAMLAGFVDAVAFVALGGFFVSFMSGNTTRLGVGVVGEMAAWQVTATLIAAFIGGVTAGSLIGRRAGSGQMRAVLVGVTALLAVAATLGAMNFSLAAGLAMAAAMGMENCVFERDGKVAFGVTYMTGAVVRVGQLLAARLSGESAEGIGRYSQLWAALALGAIGGAAAHGFVGMGALWLASAVAGAAAVAAKPG